MDATSTHPTDETLHAYALGKLDDEPADRVHGHLDGCETCRRRAAELSGDSFLGRVRVAQGPPVETVNHKPTPPPVAADTLPPGLADHPDYTIKRELGRGGMGVVYLAHNELMGRDEVLKVMGRHIIERPGVLERFLREIRAVAKLRHPNIVAAYSATRVGDSIVFAMEYVEGLDLAKMVKSKGPMPVAHACHFAHQAALGLQHAHEAGLVHRDVKPANLMLSRVGNKAAVKVLDFGLAKVTREEKVDGALTSAGQALGTPDFIAPEQIMDAQSADIRADIYSLGGTLYFLLTGRPPFRGASLYDIYQAHISRDADPLNVIRPEVPAELAALVAKMMAKEPGRRFQTPGAVAHALTPFFRKTSAGVTPTRPALSQSAATSPIEAPASTSPVRRPTRVEPATSVPDPGQPPAEAMWDSLLDLSGERGEASIAPGRRIGVESRGRVNWWGRGLVAAVGLLAVVAGFGILKAQFKGGAASPPRVADPTTVGISEAKEVEPETEPIPVPSKAIERVEPIPAPAKVVERAEPGPIAATASATDRVPPPTDLQLNKRVTDKLERIVPMRFAEPTPLGDVLASIKKSTRDPDGWEIPIYVDPMGLQEAEKSESSPVKLALQGVPLRVSLDLILRQIGLVYRVAGGTLQISAPPDRGDKLVDAGKLPRVALGDDSIETRRVVEQLGRLISIPFARDTSLGDLVKYLASATEGKEVPEGIPIFLDPAGLQEAEKSVNSTVRMKLDHVPLKHSLHFMLRQLGLGYYVRKGVLIITAYGDYLEAEVQRRDDVEGKPR